MKCYFCSNQIFGGERIFKIIPCSVLADNNLEYNFNQDNFVCHEKCLKSIISETTELPCQAKEKSIERNNILQFLEN